MSPDAQTRLFQLFNRLNKLTNPEIKGTGFVIAFLQAVIQQRNEAFRLYPLLIKASVLQLCTL